MWSIFAKIYCWWLGILLMLGLLVYGVIDVVNQQRFKQFVQHEAGPALVLINAGLNRHGDQRESAWLDIAANLTGVGWHLIPTEVAETRVDQYSWDAERARVTVPINDEFSLQGFIQDWEQLATGIGLMVLNELSLTPVEQREARFAELRQQLGLDMARVGWENEGLGFVDNRSLARGQVVVKPDYGKNQFLVYVPAGAEQALRIGPFSQFQWLTSGGIIALTLVLLVTLAIALVLVLLPLQRRLGRLTLAIDRIAEQGRTEPMPKQPADALGTMWQHINSMAQQLIDMAEQSRQLNQAVSHDLKTPLARMAFALEMLDSASDPLITNLKSDVRELTQLLDELLTYHQLSQVRTGQPSYCFPRPELEELLNSALTEHIDLTLNLGETHRMPMEAHHWRRLCRNLIVNAVQYGQGWVEVNLIEKGGWLRLSVGDDGPGFSEELKKHAFEPFVRGDRARNLNAQGHGMGLALCWNIVHHYQGHVRIDQSRLGGAQIEVSLPIIDPGSQVQPLCPEGVTAT